MPPQLASPAVVAALGDLLRQDATLAAWLATSPEDGRPGVYQDVAPQQAGFDYLVVLSASETPWHTFGAGDARKWGAEVLVYLRAVCRSGAGAVTVASRVVAILEDPALVWSVPGYDTAVVALESAGPGYTEEVRGALVYHHPVVFRVTVHGC